MPSSLRSVVQLISTAEKLVCGVFSSHASMWAWFTYLVLTRVFGKQFVFNLMKEDYFGGN